jgi:molybdate transport system ATP-binding protein
VRVGIRAGDILLATARPQQISARNILGGRVESLTQVDVTVTARVNCGAVFETHLTPGARDALSLAPGRDVWLIVKTHSCRVWYE